MSVKNMEKITSAMLALLMLGVLIESSQAIECHVCFPCDESEIVDCQRLGDVCLTASFRANGALRLTVFGKRPHLRRT